MNSDILHWLHIAVSFMDSSLGYYAVNPNNVHLRSSMVSQKRLYCVSKSGHLTVFGSFSAYDKGGCPRQAHWLTSNSKCGTIVFAYLLRFWNLDHFHLWNLNQSKFSFISSSRIHYGGYKLAVNFWQLDNLTLLMYRLLFMWYNDDTLFMWLEGNCTSFSHMASYLLFILFIWSMAEI